MPGAAQFVGQQVRLCGFSGAVDAFDDDAPVPERCQALANWTAGGWPDYYETGMVDGLEVAYEYYFDEPFCDGFTRPP